MNQRSLLFDFAAVLSAVVLMIAIYLSAYYALLERKRLDPSFGSNTAMANNRFLPKYRINSPALDVVFFPAHQLDRQLRRHYWNTLLGWHELAG